MTVVVEPERPRWQRFILRMLPWYDVQAEHERDRHSQEIRANAIAVRMRSEEVRAAYAKVAGRVER